MFPMPLVGHPILNHQATYRLAYKYIFIRIPMATVEDDREAIRKVHDAIRAVDEILLKLGIIQEADTTKAPSAGTSPSPSFHNPSTSEIPSSSNSIT